MDVRAVEGDEPDGEDLGEADVEEHVLLVVGWAVLLALWRLCHWMWVGMTVPMECTSSSIRGLMILYQR